MTEIMKLPDGLKGKGLKKGETTMTMLFQYCIKFPHTKYNEVNLLFPLAVHIMVFHIIGKCNSLGTHKHTYICAQLECQCIVWLLN